MQTAAPSTAKQIGTILFVDDESHVLSALRRTTRPMGVQCIEAQSGRAALELLAQHPVDVVVSDMRMPEMNGAMLLKQVATQYPDTIRILLTGYSDVADAVAAVNEGGIFRYLNKPWQDPELRQTLMHAVQLRSLRREKQRLEQQVKEQNAELTRLNYGLEEMVQARTQELCLTAEKLAHANRNLHDAYWTTVETFVSLMRAKDANRGVRHRAVAELSRATARRLKLSQEECDAIYAAGLLCDIGKLALPDVILAVGESQLRGEALKTYREYPLIGEAAVAMLPPLETAAQLIRSHRERLDGQGFPDRKTQDDIPLGARVLAVAHDFDAAICGELYPKPLSVDQAMTRIRESAGAWYDGAVVDAFAAALADQAKHGGIETEMALSVEQLVPGMIVTRNVLNRYGMLLMREGHTVTTQMIDTLRRLRHTNGQELRVHVRAAAGANHV
jgi:response regulator RpfG family c-di-GMP phosphodiesterase